MLTDGTTTLTAATADPGYSASRTTDISAEEVSGTNYTAGGETMTITWGESSGTVTFDDTSTPTWSTHASAPNDARYGVVYNDTATNKPAVCYIDLGGVIDIQTGDLTITWSGSGIFTLS